ncbi:CBS domain-containing protein [Nitrogeniibacter mangrovi]|uniref:CBS domain-containing protein n=1 Tax=Nitrogeniibacter mangrovi TaxID=2016596 RepID=A0A6C1B5Y8_9RHOO|nr:CBS domain-containing protein [Nitrogeniibacter mangrovi]QID18459.1 CBS domain-containing protein [Nitrogeniibacter mangrovi]
MSTTVQQILDHKGSGTISVTPEATVMDALELMAKHDVGGVLVLKDGRLVGIFTERDYARKVAIKGLSSRDATIGELMTTNVSTITPDCSTDEVMNIMTQHRFRHLPVLKDDRLCGIVTIGDVVKAVIAEHEATIHQLSSYIAGDITA